MINTKQEEILRTLIELYEEIKDIIGSDAIAKKLNRSSGTIRNQMQTLRVMGYVDGIPGPHGGYRPSIKAYERLNLEIYEKPVNVYIHRNNEKIEGVYVQKIVFQKIPHPEECSSIITVTGDTGKINNGDIIKIGPTPLNHIILKGKVVGRDDVHSEILIEADSITSIPRMKVSEFSKELITLNSGDKIKDFEKIFIDKKIDGAPVVDKNRLIGLVTLWEIVEAFSRGDYDATAGDIAIKKVLTVQKDSQLIEAVEIMDKHKVGRLIIMDNEKPVGIITRTDVISRMIE
ncbi:MAG: hypothetical protein A7315_15435 [Candidatus Altiarchaeales archaeon WOR_SM1_79]|nr:MAG: hypothetical protein A7315_15435 [Candidatus Altiarchaeales archaeon WOR_SM1_79]